MPIELAGTTLWPVKVTPVPAPSVCWKAVVLRMNTSQFVLIGASAGSAAMIAAAVSVVSVKAADVPVGVMTPPTSAEATSVVPVPLATGVLTRDGKLWASAAMAREVDIDGVIVPPLADSRKTCSVPFRGAAIDDLHLREGRRLAAALGE